MSYQMPVARRREPETRLVQFQQHVKRWDPENAVWITYRPGTHRIDPNISIDSFVPMEAGDALPGVKRDRDRDEQGVHRVRLGSYMP